MRTRLPTSTLYIMLLRFMQKVNKTDFITTHDARKEMETSNVTSVLTLAHGTARVKSHCQRTTSRRRSWQVARHAQRRALPWWQTSLNVVSDVTHSLGHSPEISGQI